jgi:hypothetical protein
VQLAALHDRVVEHVGDRTAQGLGAVDQQRHQLQPGQVGGQQLGQGPFGGGHERRETADLEVPELACSARLPTGSSPWW